MTLFEELKRRGLIAQMSHEREIEELLNSGSVKFYIGFDATADSLHIGHFMQMLTIRRFQQAGHYPVALLGTATALIGDPTGKTDIRKMLTIEEINANADAFEAQMSKYFDASAGKGEFVRNIDWFKDFKYLDFLRDVGKHFSVNKMLTAECFKSRMEKGLSFLEFNYMLLQSYDFLHLYREKAVNLQLGGDDQWSNILSGADLVRRVEQGEAFAMTFALLSTKEGKKMGKTEKGALWLDPNKCSTYDFYQNLRNSEDADVVKKLKMMTFIPIDEIEEMERTLSGAGLNKAKELLAYEVTKLVHGEEEAEKVKNAAKNVFGGSGESADMPTTTLSGEDLTGSEINILDLLVKTALCSSRRDARTNVEQGGVSINDGKITDPNNMIEIKESIIIKKGKKTFHKVKVI